MLSAKAYKKFIFSTSGLISILIIGPAGYWFISGGKYSFLDCLYMTIITITTIGYGEIIDLSNNPAGRIFTIFIALSGISILFYIITNVTAFIIEGELTASFRRKKMEKLSTSLKEHYIVCGAGRLGLTIANELSAVQMPHVLVEVNRDRIENVSEAFQNYIVIEGDATDDNTLLKAGIKKAKGLFAVTDNDNQNLVINLTAKQLNPALRIVTRCNEISYTGKMRKSGADAVVAPNYIGGLRMASEMIRPSVVSFLDIMLRDKDKNLRVEEVSVPESFMGKPVSTLNLKKYPHTLLLAIKAGEDWIYNPPEDYVISHKNTLILMTTSKEKHELEKIFHS
jgi:voltage-gated potassium channel